jgi:hypothetical protein
MAQLELPATAQRGWRFSLRGLFALITAVGVLLAANVGAIRFSNEAEGSAVEAAAIWVIGLDLIAHWGLMLWLALLVAPLAWNDSLAARETPHADLHRLAVIVAMTLLTAIALTAGWRMSIATGLITLRPDGAYLGSKFIMTYLTGMLWLALGAYLAAFFRVIWCWRSQGSAGASRRVR